MIHKWFSIFLALFCISCSDSDLLITNDQNDIQSSIVGFTSNNSGIVLTSVDLLWNSFENTSITLSITDSIIDVGSINQYSFEGLSPGWFDKVVLTIELDSETLTDSITVFTRPLEPAKNFNVSPFFTSNGYKQYELSWDNSEDVNKNILYKVSIFEEDDPDISFENGELNSQWDSLTVFDKLYTSFIDTSLHFSDSAYYYIIKTVEKYGAFRYSKIPNIESPIQNSTFSFTNLTDDLYHRIELEWDPYLDEDFYEMELWRSSNYSSPVENGKQLGVFSDPSIDFYYDVNNLVGGVDYYYQMKITNIFGYSTISEIVSGRSHP